jgi:hypothetical protein
LHTWVSWSTGKAEKEEKEACVPRVLLMSDFKLIRDLKFKFDFHRRRVSSSSEELSNLRGEREHHVQTLTDSTVPTLLTVVIEADAFKESKDG